MNTRAAAATESTEGSMIFWLTGVALAQTAPCTGEFSPSVTLCVTVAPAALWAPAQEALYGYTTTSGLRNGRVVLGTEALPGAHSLVGALATAPRRPDPATVVVRLDGVEISHVGGFGMRAGTR